jgi:hypothetical protein
VSQTDHLEQVGKVVTALTALGLQPTLVGGMALVVLGSQRVTRDFDFVVAHPGERLHEFVDRLYGRGFELVSRLDEHGDVSATIDDPRVAATRLRLDRPVNASFFDPVTRLRIDLLFDFPIAASLLAERAVRRTIRSVVLHLAGEADLLQLKRIALADRASASDAQDIAFLEARISRG